MSVGLHPVPAKPLCLSCRFWRAHTYDSAYRKVGDCRRHAPRQTAHQNDPETRWAYPASAVWPETTPEDFCGEFEAVQPVEAV